ncbi:unnamed protein product [Peniophora sp. CBMAI 1063]|nr:unnamed protein product [Peniophora sp. CBMAI 1063]
MLGMAPSGEDQARISIQVPINDEGSVGDAFIAPSSSSEDISLPQDTLKEGEARTVYKKTLTPYAASDTTSDDEEELRLLYPSPPPSPPKVNNAMDVDEGTPVSSQRCVTPHPTVAPPQVVPPRNRTVALPPTEQYNDLSKLPQFITDPMARLRLRRIRQQTMPRGVRQAKANIVGNRPYARISPRNIKADDGPYITPDYSISRTPDWAHTPQEAAEYSVYLDRHLLAKLYYGLPNFDINGKYIGSTREGHHSSYLTNTLIDWAIRPRLPLACAMVLNLEYRGRCARNALPVPRYQRLMYTDEVSVEKIHRDMHMCGVSPDKVDYAMGPTVTILEWAVKTKSGIVSKKKCRYALGVGRERLSRLPPMPHSYLSYRAALLERILLDHRDEVKNLDSFSAEDFPDVLRTYSLEIHERRLGLL